MNYLKIATIIFIATLSINSFSSINRVEVDGDQYYAHFECYDEEKVLSEINSFIEAVKDNEVCNNKTIEKVEDNNCESI